jgi:glycosyltransferase involved in cell wall biosynthesis
MRISVVIPAYNAESFLADTIHAARAQTLAPLEIIVVDDGSTDDTSDVAKGLGCRVIRQANGGVCVARNTGILAARGDWIALLDHDDLWLPEKLERQAAAVALQPEVGCVATDFLRLRDGQSDPVSCLALPEYRLDALTMVPLADEIAHCPRAGEELLMTGWFLFPSSMLIRRDILLAAGLFRPEQRLCEDVDCLLRVMRHTGLLLVRAPLWRWRKHDRNTSRDQTGIAEGWLRLAQYVRSEPDAYPPGTDARLPAILRDMRRSLVSEYTARRDFTSARRVSRTPIGGSITPRDAVLAVVVELPPAFWGVLRRARSAMRAFSLRL